MEKLRNRYIKVLSPSIDRSEVAIVPSQGEVGDLDEGVAVEEALAPGCVEVSEGLGRNDLLDGLSGGFQLLDAFLDSDEHVAGLGEVGFGAKRAVPRDDLRLAVDERKDFLVRGNHTPERAAGAGIDEGIHGVKEGVAEVDNIGLLEMDTDVGVSVCGREML